MARRLALVDETEKTHCARGARKRKKQVVRASVPLQTFKPKAEFAIDSKLRAFSKRLGRKYPGKCSAVEIPRDLISDMDDLRWGKNHAIVFWRLSKHGWGLYWMHSGNRMEPIYRAPIQIREAAWELVDEIEDQLAGTWEVE